MRENHPKETVAQGPAGARRTLNFVIRRENQTDVGTLATRFIAPETVISADESDAYDLLHARFPMRRVNHQCEYRADDGTTNNQAKSYFSRFRRMEIGQTHKFGNRHLANYANEAAYREDTRRWSNGEIFRDIVTKCARTLTSGLVRLLAGQQAPPRAPGDLNPRYQHAFQVLTAPSVPASRMTPLPASRLTTLQAFLRICSIIAGVAALDLLQYVDELFYGCHGYMAWIRQTIDYGLSSGFCLLSKTECTTISLSSIV